MDRVAWIKHGGARILRIDFSQCEPQGMLDVIAAAQEVIGTEPKGSVRTLTIVTDARFNSDVNARMKTYVAHNKPFVSAAAIVGLSGLQRIVYTAVIKFSGRVIRICDDEITAKHFLSTAT